MRRFLFASFRPLIVIHAFLSQDPTNPTASHAPPSLLVTPTAASLSASVAHAHSHQHLSPTAPNAPKQEGDSWDEFPNGRFTDTRSPAYGELDGYGAGLKILVGVLSFAVLLFVAWGLRFERAGRWL